MHSSGSFVRSKAAERCFLIMLSNEGVALPQPKEPGFFTERRSLDIDSFIDEGRSHTGTTFTITILVAR